MREVEPQWPFRTFRLVGYTRSLFRATVFRNGLLEILQLFAGQEADVSECGEMPLRARHVSGHEIGLADVLVSAAMARIELDRALIVLEGEVELLQVAIGVAQVVLQIGVVGMPLLRALEEPHRLCPVLLVRQPLAGGIVRVAPREIGVGIVRIRRATEANGAAAARKAASRYALMPVIAGRLASRGKLGARGVGVLRELEQLRVVLGALSRGRRPAPPRARRRRSRGSGWARALCDASNSLSACAGCFNSSSISPSSSRAGTMRPGVTMCFSFLSSRSAAARMNLSASSDLPSPSAIQPADGEPLDFDFRRPVGVLRVEQRLCSAASSSASFSAAASRRCAPRRALRRNT